MSEVKSVAVKDFELKDTGEVIVQFSKLNEIDHDKDVTYPGAIPTKDVPMSAFGHTSWPQRGSNLPPGRGTVAEDGDFGLFRGKFFMGTTHGRDTYETVKELKELQEWSYGYDVVDSEPRPKSFPGARRGLKLLDVHEVSPVLLGAGLATQTIAIKSLDGIEELDLLVGSFAEQRDRVLAALKALHSREEDIIDLRLKEGRAISSERRRKLAEQRDLLASLLEGTDALLSETEPAPKGDDENAEGKGRIALLKARADLLAEVTQRGYRIEVPASA